MVAAAIHGREADLAIILSVILLVRLRLPLIVAGALDGRADLAIILLAILLLRLELLLVVAGAINGRVLTQRSSCQPSCG